MIKKKYLFTIFVLLLVSGLLDRAVAQFAPAVGIEGTTAISADSSVFVAWGSHGQLERGLMKINEPEMGLATFGTESDAYGKADLVALSLGDGGSFTYYFEIPVIDGPGPDFAVFENSFSNDFLELAHVEVSSDGLHFARFRSVSLTQTQTQVDGFGVLEAVKIHNLAGKYRGLYGTPFDLAELDDPDLDRNAVHYIRITDVVGSIDPVFGSRDSEENLINDPWPTPFPSSGFDLDALGVIYDQRYSSVTKISACPYHIYPNPFKDFLFINGESDCEVSFFDALGKTIMIHQKVSSHEWISTQRLMPGFYCLKIQNNHGSWMLKLLKQ